MTNQYRVNIKLNIIEKVLDIDFSKLRLVYKHHSPINGVSPVFELYHEGIFLATVCVHNAYENDLSFETSTHGLGFVTDKTVMSQNAFYSTLKYLEIRENRFYGNEAKVFPLFKGLVRQKAKEEGFI